MSLKRTGLPTVAVLVDDSASMGIADRYENTQLEELVTKRIGAAELEEPSRLNLAKTVLLNKGSNLLAGVERRYRLKLYWVGSAARPNRARWTSFATKCKSSNRAARAAGWAPACAACWAICAARLRPPSSA